VAGQGTQPETGAVTATAITRKRRTRADLDAILDVAVEILRADNPMTVRQAYYRLVSRQVTQNNRSEY